MANNRLIVQFGQTAGAIGGTYDIFGSNTGTETVVVYENTIANFQGDFARGGDTIRLRDVATDFTIRLAGSNAQLISTSDGIVATIPVGITGATIQFETAPNVFGDSRTLIFNGTNVTLGGQILTTTATAVDPAAPPAGPAISGHESALDAALIPTAPAALDAPTFAAFGGGAHGSLAELQVAHIESAFFARASMESGMTNFVVNFA